MFLRAFCESHQTARLGSVRHSTFSLRLPALGVGCRLLQRSCWHVAIRTQTPLIPTALAVNVLAASAPVKNDQRSKIEVVGELVPSL